jgi:iron complex transport system ATP-binding protein
MTVGGRGDLIARDLAVALGGQVILDGIDARFRPGQVTAIVGPNGAGKSTLLA